MHTLLYLVPRRLFYFPVFSMFCWIFLSPMSHASVQTIAICNTSEWDGEYTYGSSSGTMEAITWYGAKCPGGDNYTVLSYVPGALLTLSFKMEKYGREFPFNDVQAGDYYMCKDNCLEYELSSCCWLYSRAPVNQKNSVQHGVKLPSTEKKRALPKK